MLAKASNAVRAAAQVAIANDGEINQTNEQPIIEAATPQGKKDLMAVIDEFSTQINPTATNDLIWATVTPPRPLSPADLANRQTDFIKAWPEDKMWTSTAHRLTMPNVGVYPNFEWSAIGNTYDLKAIEDFMQGSPFKPLVGVTDQGNVAFGQLLLNEGKDSSFGYYTEAIFSVYAVPKDAADADSQMKFAPGKSGESTTLPPLKGATFFFIKLLLPTQNAIDFGRERMGADKVKGTLTFTNEGSERKFVLLDDKGAKVLSGAVATQLTPAEQATTQAQTMAALTAASIPPPTQAPPPQYTTPLAGRLSPTSQTVTTGLALSLPPTTNKEIGEQDIHWGHSKWVKLVRDQLHFKPLLSIYTPFAQAALKVP